MKCLVSFEGNVMAVKAYPVVHSLHRAPFAAVNSSTNFWRWLQQNSFHSARAFLAPLGPWPLISLTSMMRWTFPLMPLCLILQESMMERMNSETKVEQLERREFLGVEPAFFGACLFMKTSSWPIQYAY